MPALPSNEQARKYLDLCLILKMFPLDSVDTSLWFTDTQGIRRRSMTPHVIICFVILRWLDRQASDKEILRHILNGLAWFGLREPTAEGDEEIGKSGLSQARSRIGWRPFEIPAIDICRPIHSETNTAAHFRQWQGVSLDSTTFSVDSRNQSEFGRRAGKKKPEIRLAALIEHGTNVLFGADMGAVTDGEHAISAGCLDSLRDTMICLGDVGTFGYGMFKAARRKGAQIIWRVPDALYLPFVQGLPDGTYFSDLFQDRTHCRARLDGVMVRVIELSRSDEAPGRHTRLITTLLDYSTAPAREIASFFHSRRTIPLALESSRIKAPGEDIAIRSRTPDLVRQEIYGLLFAHFLLCDLMRDFNEIHDRSLRAAMQERVKIVRRRAADVEAALCVEESFFP